MSEAKENVHDSQNKVDSTQPDQSTVEPKQPQPDLTDPKTAETKKNKSANTPVKKKGLSRKMKLLIGVGLFVGFAIILTGVFLGIVLLMKDSSDSDNDSKGNKSDEAVVEDEAEQKSEDELDGTDDGDALIGDDSALGARKIAYMKDANIWVMETDGSNKTQITLDGNRDTIRYTAMDWQERGLLSYAKCDGSCNVYTYDLVAESESLEHTPPPFTETIADITWSHDGTILGILYTKADYSYTAYVVDGGISTDIATFGIPPARGAGYSDGLQINFSPDDSKVLVLNSIVDFGEDTIVATEIDGTPITTIAEATHPTFDGNTGFYFVADGRIKKYTFATGSINNILLLGTNGGYNPETSPDRNFIAYWNEAADGETHLYFHDVAGSPDLIADGFAEADWLDNSELVAVKTAPGIGMGYQSEGLSKIERVGGAETALEAGNVYNFEIEPL
ncbi:hypothetical protein GF389_03190 [Candidatus Dojkabacteria bacterium]|nr:hypothetical protein [Candidatus Dojkabacteria bacterium]